jgi:trehalose/maltose hydrolase-like predicted phosphorylase
MNLDVDQRRISRGNISNYMQILNMREAMLETTFDVEDKVSVKHQVMSLRHLPYTAMSIVEITAKKKCRSHPDVRDRGTKSSPGCQKLLC